MQKFEYVIKDEIGIHARPAGMLAKTAGKYKSSVRISCGGMEADASRLMAVMSLGVRCGSKVEVTAEGPDEEEAIDAVKEFFESHL